MGWFPGPSWFNRLIERGGTGGRRVTIHGLDDSGWGSERT